MNEELQAEFAQAVMRRITDYPHCHTVVLSSDGEEAGSLLRNWEGNAAMLYVMGTALLSDAVHEATAAGDFAVANRIDAALEMLGTVAVIRSRRVIGEAGQ